MIASIPRTAPRLCFLACALAATSCGIDPSSWPDLPPLSDAGADLDVDANVVADVDAGPDVAVAADTSSSIDSAPPLDTSAEAHFSIPRTTGSYELGFDIAIDGEGSERVGRVDVVTGAGTIEIAGESLPLAIYERQQWEEFGYDLYQAIAVHEDRWHVLWFYCEGESLSYIWEQATDGTALEVFSATGTCSGSTSPSTVQVDFPAVELPIPPLLDGFRVEGPEVDVRPGVPGTVDIGGIVLEVYPFSHVDCTTDCGANGWHELHALLSDPRREWLCFGIFYLFLDDSPPRLGYTFSFPILAEPFGTVSLMGATWTDVR